MGEQCYRISSFVGKGSDIIAELEFSILYALQALHTPWMDEIMKGITSLGNKGWIWILTGVILFLFKKTRKTGTAVLLSLLAVLLLGNLILKPSVARLRPCWLDRSVPLLIEVPKDYSFPSGHSMASFAAAASLWFADRRWGCLALLLAGLIAFSRLYLFVHFPTDVLCGILLGILAAWLVRFGGRQYKRQKEMRRAGE